MNSPRLLAIVEQIKREMRLLTDIFINQYLIPWDQKLTALAKELTRVFYLENDYLLIIRTHHGVLEDSKYSKRIIQKTLETLLKRIEEISPDLEKFLAFNARQLRIIDQKQKKISKLLNELRLSAREFDPKAEDFFNTLHEFNLYVQNLTDELIYDSTTKREIYNELSMELLKAEKKGLELIRFYMICLQNSSLLMDIKQINYILSFSNQLTSTDLTETAVDTPTLHSQFLNRLKEL
ncbi:MAG: hypothetical protein ACXAC7_11875 [Candidatus Hodarchaeales archaeon]|jgi:hypothetical protein